MQLFSKVSKIYYECCTSFINFILLQFLLSYVVMLLGSHYNLIYNFPRLYIILYYHSSGLTTYQPYDITLQQVYMYAIKWMREIYNKIIHKMHDKTHTHQLVHENVHMRTNNNKIARFLYVIMHLNSLSTIKLFCHGGK